MRTALVALLALAGAVPPAGATQCPPSSLEAEFAAADFVFVGRVLEKEWRTWVPPGERTSLVTLTVDEEFKGLVSGFATPGPDTSRSPYARVSVLNDPVSMGDPFTPDEQYVVFARGRSFAVPVVDECGGTARLADIARSSPHALDDLRRLASELEPPPALLGPGGPGGPYSRTDTGTGWSPGWPFWLSLAANAVLAATLWRSRRADPDRRARP